MQSLATITTLILTFLVACTLPGDPATPGDPTNPNNPFAAAEQNEGYWTWIPVDESTCRDGSSTGIGVRLQPNTKNVLIYLQGGGACYDAQSCKENAEGNIAGASYSGADFSRWVTSLGNQGVFNTKQGSNALAEWNHVYIPYCTGDLHAGSNPNARIEGIANLQQFVGHKNMATFLNLLAPYFKEAEDVALMGASAGGFGVLFNYPQVAQSFKPTPIKALVDSAPIFETETIKTSCFQEKALNAFNLQVPGDCANCNKPEQGGLLNLYGYLSENYPEGKFAFASSDADLAGIILLDRESKACGGSGVNLLNYKTGLFALRDNTLKPTGKWSSFYWGGIQHTFTQTNSLYFDKAVQGVTPAEWLTQVMSGKILHIAP